MSYKLEIENRAVKQIRDIHQDMRTRIVTELDNLRHNPRPPGCIKLKGRGEPAWRVRVGDYRILYRIHDDERMIRVYGVLRRDEAYRD